MSKQNRTSYKDDRIAVARAAKFNFGREMSARPVRANDYPVEFFETKRQRKIGSRKLKV